MPIVFDLTNSYFGAIDPAKIIRRALPLPFVPRIAMLGVIGGSGFGNNGEDRHCVCGVGRVIDDPFRSTREADRISVRAAETES